MYRNFDLKIRSRPAVVLLAAMSWLFAACQNAPAPQAPPLASASLVVPAATSADKQDPLPAVPTAEVSAPGSEVPTQPAVRTELAATDPAGVNLASGKPTLVEFFAFW